MGTDSPRMTEYGRVKDTKKGWKAVMATGADTPSPVLLFVQNAEPCHEVIVCGSSSLILISVFLL